MMTFNKSFSTTLPHYLSILLPQAGIVWTKTKACLTCLVSWLIAFTFTAPIFSITQYTFDPEKPACMTEVDDW